MSWMRSPCSSSTPNARMHKYDPGVTSFERSDLVLGRTEGTIPCLANFQNAEQVHGEHEVLLIDGTELGVLLVQMHENDFGFRDQAVSHMRSDFD